MIPEGNPAFHPLLEAALASCRLRRDRCVTRSPTRARLTRAGSGPGKGPRVVTSDHHCLPASHARRAPAVCRGARRGTPLASEAPGPPCSRRFALAATRPRSRTSPGRSQVARAGETRTSSQATATAPDMHLPSRRHAALLSGSGSRARGSGLCSVGGPAARGSRDAGTGAARSLHGPGAFREHAAPLARRLARRHLQARREAPGGSLPPLAVQGYHQVLGGPTKRVRQFPPPRCFLQGSSRAEFPQGGPVFSGSHSLNTCLGRKLVQEMTDRCRDTGRAGTEK